VKRSTRRKTVDVLTRSHRSFVFAGHFLLFPATEMSSSTRNSRACLVSYRNPTPLAKMKDSIASGETTLVNPVNAKHSLNETAAVVEEERIEGMLMDEEEHLMEHDEEITSEEETEDHTEAEERKMLTVALVNSVVETTQDGENRYGLRKRRRPAGEDLRVLEHNQSSKDGGLARSPKMETDDETDPAEPTDPGPETKASAMVTTESVDITKLSATEGEVKPEAPRPPPGQLKRPAASPAPAPAPAPKPEPEPSSSTITMLPSSSSVPNPLGALPIPASTMSLHSSKAAHANSVAATVPCPLPGASVVKTEAPDTSEKRKVTINEPSYRSRGFSIDLESVGFDFGEETSGQTELPAGGRNRAFSFECFAFGINADEPLPPLASHDTDSMSMGRPRGDSIIFDPTSFQDGGIHEQSALEKARLAPSAEGSNRKVKTTPPMADAAVSQHGTSAAGTQAGVAAPVTSYTTTTTTATSTTTTTTVIPSPSATTTNGTFSMDLLNKEGRIGIYLPAARKERIARFHEKRARRIWRKRIKYDCRKKLADSRPRIKGRFVKRSDMDEDVV
jgi:hypothetical protein